jgi:hypothetical protein
MQQVNEPVRFDQVRATIVANQGQYTFISVGVEVPVPDEVQRVPLLTEQEILKGSPRCLRRPAHIN